MMKNVKNKGTAPLDTRIKSEHDNSVSSLLSLSDHETPSLPPLGVEHTTSPLSPSGLTRGSRSYEYRMESGRSMVEMLGVLAVIGVLSIGGIMGYSYGMDKYRANQTMQELTLRGIDVLAQFDRTGDANLNEWQNEKTIYPITLEEGTIGIQVDEVPERVCDIITDGMTYVAKGTKVNGSYVVGDTNACDGDKNTLVFYFDEESVADTFRCTANNGQSGYTIMDMCLPDGTQMCIAEFGNVEDCPYDPECIVVDSDYPIPMNGIPCKKNGVQGACSVGICQTENTLCGGIDCLKFANDEGIDPVCIGCSDDTCTYLAMMPCYKDGQIGICSESGTCSIPSPCTSYADCDKGRYCKGLSENGEGACTDLPSYTTKTITFTDENGIERTENWYLPQISSEWTNWYVAKDVCSTSGWRMAKAEDFFSEWHYSDDSSQVEATQNNRGKVLSSNLHWLEDTPPHDTTKRLRGGDYYMVIQDANSFFIGSALCTDK